MVVMRKTKPLADRAWAKVEIRGPDECWLWKGARGKNGHGHIIIGGRGSAFTTAHRVIYESARGPIPDGIEVCHSCDNRACCNPKHLFLGTHKENMLDMARKLRSPRRRLELVDVIRIRELWAQGGNTKTAIGKQFGVSRVQVANIVSRKHWVA